jgi:osmotically inducible lipoprotein OsmB
MHTTDIQAVQFKNQSFKNQGYKKQSLIKTSVVDIALCLSLSSCGTMTNRGKSTAIGAGIGAVAGAVLKGVSA